MSSVLVESILLESSKSVLHHWPANVDPVDLVDFSEEQAYKTYDCYLQYKGSVSVSPDSVIYRGVRLDIHSVVQADLLSYYRYRHLIKKRFFSKQITLSAGKNYLLATDLWSSGHFHWICDVLPRLWLVRNKASDFTLLLPDIPYLRTIGMESLALLDIRFSDIVWMDVDSFYRVPELYFISPVQRSGHMHPEILCSIRDRFLQGFQAGTGKIYISRQNANFRKIENEGDFTQLLKGYGYEVIHSQDYSLSQQLTIFSSASSIVGIHGAGLANAIFQHPGSTMVELRRKENGPYNVGYWHFADALRHQYYYFNGIPDSSLPLVGKGCNLKIDLSQFEKKVLQLLHT